MKKLLILLYCLFASSNAYSNPKNVLNLGCKDFIEVNQYSLSNSENEYRLRNSWFNHQGILLDEYKTVKDTITINTFVSQAYYLESYTINKITGETKRSFYSFNDPKFFNAISKLEANKKNVPLYNKKGKLSLKTLESLSLKPKEIFHFEGQCYKGLPV